MVNWIGTIVSSNIGVEADHEHFSLLKITQSLNSRYTVNNHWHFDSEHLIIAWVVDLGYLKHCI